METTSGLVMKSLYNQIKKRRHDPKEVVKKQILGSQDQLGRRYWTSNTTSWLQRSEELVPEDAKGALSRDGRRELAHPS